MIVMLALTTMISMIGSMKNQTNTSLMAMRGWMLPSVIKVVMRKVTLRKRGMMT